MSGVIVERCTAVGIERALLGGALLDPSVLGWLELEGRDFFNPRNRVVWEAFRAVHDAELAVDPATVEHHLRQVGRLEAIGGLSYLSELAVETPTPDNVEHYARLLRQHREARDVLLAVDRAKSRLEACEIESDELLDEMTGALARVVRRSSGESMDIADMMAPLAKEFVANAERLERGESATGAVPTGIDGVDLPIGVPSSIAAIQGFGKSAFILQVALAVIAAGFIALVFTLEDPRVRWAKRRISRVARVPNKRVQSGRLNPEELGKVLDACEKIRRTPGLYAFNVHGMTAQQIARVAKTYARSGNVGLVAVDYVQKLRAPERGMSKLESITASSYELGDVAAELDCAVLIASQLVKDVESGENGKPRRANVKDFRYGHGLADATKCALFLHGESRDAEDIELCVGKENQGEAGLVIPLRYERAFSTFTRAEEKPPW